VNILLNERIEILNHQRSFINFAQSLANFNESQLREPIDAGKWSVIEIIGHFYAWDEFILHNRLPYFLTENTLPPGPEADDLNKQSALLARQASVQNTIRKCIRIRTELVEKLESLPPENWVVEFKINNSMLTIYQYFKGLMEHDIHHLNQIKQALNILQNKKIKPN